MSETKASNRVRGIQRTALAMLVMSGSINTIDRAALSVANPLIREDLNLSIAEMGILLSAFLWAYAFAQLPTGALIDRIGPRKLLGLGLAVWSSAQLACGLVHSVGQFALARVVLGIGEAPNFPTGGRVVRDWFNRSKRGSAAGIFTSASYIGTAIAAPLLTFLMLSFGWRWMFIIMGGIGLVAAVIWYAVYREPSQVDLTEEEKAHIREGDAEDEVKQPVTFKEWRRLFRCAPTWSMIIGYSGVTYVGWVFNAWLPGYLEMTHHLDLKTTGWLAAVPFVFAIGGALSAGFIIDALMARSVSMIRSRQVPLCIAMVLNGLFVLGAAFAPTTAWAVAAISAAMFCNTASVASAWAIASVIAPSNCTGSLGAMQNFGGYMGGAFAPIITGFLVQGTGSFAVAFIVCAVMCLVAAISFSTIRKPIKPEDLLIDGDMRSAQRA